MLLNDMDTHKHISHKNCQSKSFSLYTCKLVIQKSLLTIKTQIKSHLNCIDIIAYFCVKRSEIMLVGKEGCEAV